MAGILTGIDISQGEPQSCFDIGQCESWVTP
jgi:hypothetical protein